MDVAVKDKSVTMVPLAWFPSKKPPLLVHPYDQASGTLVALLSGGKMFYWNFDSYRWEIIPERFHLDSIDLPDNIGLRTENTTVYDGKHAQRWFDGALKQSIRGKLQRAINKGIIKRPDDCEKCNETCSPMGHHEDYDKPFDVIWVCRKCHAKIHSKAQ